MSFKLPEQNKKKHLLTKYSDKARKILMKMGFEEVYLKPILPDKHVKKQYGPEAPAILDRLFYIATLPRPDIGLSKNKKDKIKKKIKGFNKFKKLKKVLKDYKRNKISHGEDFTEELVTKLGITSKQAFFLINEVFYELKNIKPEPTNHALISHATTAWFPTLQKVVNKKKTPICLFSFPWRHRREQREDATHLKSHYNLSMVIMNPLITIHDGMKITKKFFKKMGFERIIFKKKPNQPAYYENGTNYEVFVKYNNKLIEVSEIGMYDKKALKKYGINMNVFNSGPGLGRIIMIKEKIDDIRKVHYPEFYEELELSDEELADMIKIDKKPNTKEGKKLVKDIIKKAKKNREKKAPLTIKVNESVEIYEPDKGVNLLGPAALNKIVVKESNVLGVLKKQGADTNITILEAVANLAGHKYEQKKSFDIRVTMVNSTSDVNIKINPVARKYITSKKKRIDIKGPVFIGIRKK